jgi:hypothetical protein
MTARLHWWKEKADPIEREKRRKEKKREGFNSSSRPQNQEITTYQNT